LEIASIFRIAVGLTVVLGVTVVDAWIFGFNSATVILTYILVILVLATRWGVVESTVASFAAMLCLNFFFLPPVGTFTIIDPHNWVALIAFLGTGITVSHLSARAKERTEEAIARQREMEQLLELGRSFMLADPGRPLSEQVAGLISMNFNLDGVAYFDRHEDRSFRVGSLEMSDDQLRSSAAEGTVFQDWAQQVTALPVTLGGVRLGSLALATGKITDSACYAITNLIAIALEGNRAQQVAAQADLDRHNQEFKAALLDAVAHELKTPLTAIKAAVTTLLSDPKEADPDLLSVIDEETDQLTDLVTEAIQMSRLEAGALAIQRRPLAVADIVERATSRLRARLEKRTFSVRIPQDLPLVWADSDLSAIVLQQLLSNAINYSAPEKPIILEAGILGGNVAFHVKDEGPGIPAEEQGLIFDRFYRGAEVRGKTQGTGLGLSIAREIVRAHGGQLTVRSEPGLGSVFSFTLQSVTEEGL